jgi:HK97 family phage major capsid protein
MSKKMKRLIKALSLNAQLQRISDAFYSQFPVSDQVDVSDYWIAETFDDHIIAEGRGEYFEVSYTDDGEEIVFADREEWGPVEREIEWVKKSVQMEMIQTGRNTLKALSIEDDFARVGNYIALFGDENNRDIEGEYFTRKTVFDSMFTKSGILMLDWEHGMPVDGELGPQNGEFLGVVDWSTKAVDDVGLWVERVLDRRKKYVEALLPLIKNGMLGTSSEAISSKTKVSKDGEILRWPLKRDTLTVWPAETRMMLDNTIQPAMKNLLISLIGDEPDKDSGRKSDGKSSNSAKVKTNLEANIMNLQELLELFAEKKGKTVPELTPDEFALAVRDTPYAVSLASKPATEPAIPAGSVKGGDAPPDPPIDPYYKAMEDQVKSLGEQLEKVMDLIESAPGLNKSGYVTNDGGKADKNIQSFGDFCLAVKRKDTVRLKSIYGSVYADFDDNGEMKAMVENTGVDGGFLIPTVHENRILSVQPEASVVRGSGAMQLPVAGPVGSLPALDQGTAPTAGIGDTAYAGGVVGGWEGEGSAGSETQPDFKMLEYHVRKLIAYTLASNEVVADSPIGIESLLTVLFGRFIAAKEDYAFLRGDGVKKPLGILNSGCAIGITPATNNVFALADALSMISRLQPVGMEGANSIVWAAHRSTIPDIGAFEAGTGGSVWLADQAATLQGRPLLGYPIKFSEHLPQANNSGHVILGDMGGYIIFDRAGMLLDFSKEVKFLNDQSAWRISKRADGKPWVIDAITLADPQGSYTVSPFIYFND